MKSLLQILMLLVLVVTTRQGFSQDPIIIQPRYDSITQPQLSIPQVPIPQLSIDNSSAVTEVRVRISPDSLDAKVEYGSLDSNYLDNESRRVYLFGNAYVRYKDLSITADYIVVDLDSSIATAQGMLDSVGQMAGLPEFKMGEEQFTAGKMRYNFRTRIGKIYEAVTKQNDLFIHGEETKFVANADTITHDDILYGKRALITTCDAPHPHFGIRASKIKTIPNKLAVIGSSNLEIFGIPTPAWLPFGFYPVSEERRAGLLLPRDYERSREWGFGLKQLGYYLPLSDNADLTLVGDIYFNGSWGAGVITKYLKKYKYNGAVDLRFSNRISEPPNTYLTTSQKSYSIRLSHTQDQKANPYQTIGGSINITTNDYESLNNNDATSVFTNTYYSNFSYNRRFPDKPYTLSAALTHSQNTNTRIVTINAPELKFNLNRIYPFRSKNRLGPEKFYEKIAFQYNGTGRSVLEGRDTSLFDKATWANFQYGVQHHANANVNFNVLKYFNFTPSLDYGETWFFKTQEHAFAFDADDPRFVRNDTIFNPDDSTQFIILPDTISNGVVDDTLNPGFKAFRTFSASISMNTQVFGTMQFNKGWLRGIRHVIKPSIGFSYSPQSPPDYYENIRVSVLYPDSVRPFSRFDGLLFSVRPVDVTQANLNYSITNLFEAKFFSKRDSTEKKLKLFDNINVSGSYNMAAEKFQFSPLNISGTTRFFKGITTVSMGATYSFYRIDANNRLIDEDFKFNRPLRFDQMRLRFSTRLSYDDIVKIFKKKGGLDNSPKEPTGIKSPASTPDKFLDLLSSFSISHELGFLRLGMIGRDTNIVTTHSVNLIGTMRLTPNWSVRFGNIGYDFRAKELTYPDISLTRDLHCWQMSFSFQPDRGTYSFHLGVKPGTFDFLKYSKRQGNEVNNGF